MDALAEIGVVAPGQAKDELVDAGDLGRRHHLGVGDVRLEAGDVVADGAGEQLGVLRQVADVAAEVLAVPGENVGPVEADIAVVGLPDAHHQPRERRLAGARRTDDAQHLARLDLEVDALQDELLRAGRGEVDTLHRQAPRGAGQAGDRLGRLVVTEDLHQPVEGPGALQHAVPGAYQPVDGLEGAGGQDHVGEQQARVNLALHHEIGADGDDQNLDALTPELADVGEAAGHAAGVGATVHCGLAEADPTAAQSFHHAHGPHNLAIAQGRVSEGVAAQGCVIGFGQHGTGGPILDQGDGHQNHGAQQGHDPHKGVDGPQHQQEDRHPGQVEDHAEGGARQHLAEGVEVTQGLGAQGRIAAHHAVKQSREYVARDPLVHDHAVAHQDLGPVVVDDTGDGEGGQHAEGDHQQGGNAAAAHHPPIDLEGVERQRHVKQVRDQTERRGHGQGGIALTDRPRQRIVRLIGRQQLENLHGRQAVSLLAGEGSPRRMKSYTPTVTTEGGKSARQMIGVLRDVNATPPGRARAAGCSPGPGWRCGQLW